MRRYLVLILLVTVGCDRSPEYTKRVEFPNGSIKAASKVDSKLESDDQSTSDESKQDSGTLPKVEQKPNSSGDNDDSPDPVIPNEGTAPVNQDYNPCPKNGSPCAIMPLGDSITYGYNSADIGGYRVPLFRKANANSQSITFVGRETSGPQKVDGLDFPQGTEGYPSFAIENINVGNLQGISELVEAGLDAHKPHIITLMIGTNDCGWRADLPKAPERLGRLLDKIAKKSPETLVVLAQIIPTTNDDTNVGIKPYNLAMVDLVKKRKVAGMHITLVDMYTAFTSSPDYKNKLYKNELHPNEAGFVVMSDVWYEAVKGFLPKK